MENLVNMIISLFSVLTDNSIFGMPVLVWLILPAVITLTIKFIQGKK